MPNRNSKNNKSSTLTMDAVYTKPGYLFRRMQQIAVAIFVEECKAYDLTPVQYAALVAIHTHPGIDATRLSAVIAFDRSTLGNVIERLEAKRYVERRPAREDRRVKLLYLTRSGATLLRNIMPSVDRAQARQLFQILIRMCFAGEHVGEGADLGTPLRVLGQQRRLGMGLVEPLDDGERLGQDTARIILQRRHQPLRVDDEIGRRMLFALAKVMRQVLAPQTLQVQRDSDPVGRAAAEIAMQLHRNLPHFYRFVQLTLPIS